MCAVYSSPCSRWARRFVGSNPLRQEKPQAELTSEALGGGHWFSSQVTFLISLFSRNRRNLSKCALNNTKFHFQKLSTNNRSTTLFAKLDEKHVPVGVPSFFGERQSPPSVRKPPGGGQGGGITHQ